MNKRWLLLLSVTVFVFCGQTWTLPSGNSQGGLMSPFCLPHTAAPVEWSALIAMPPAAVLVSSPSEFLVAQYHRLPYTHRPALPGKGGWASLLARIQPGQVLGFRGQRKGTFQGSTYFLRTSVPISLAHMIYWDILHVPNVSMLRKIASVGQSCGAFLYKCTGIAWEDGGWGSQGLTPHLWAG